MNELVVDASTIGNVILAEVSDARMAAIRTALTACRLVQPAHWPIEISGLVLKASRRHRLSVDDRAVARDAIAAIIASATVEAVSRAKDAFDLAVAQNISVYDAAYLELAWRMGLPLLASDGPLIDATRRLGVELVELP